MTRRPRNGSSRSRWPTKFSRTRKSGPGMTSSVLMGCGEQVEAVGEIPSALAAEAGSTTCSTPSSVAAEIRSVVAAGGDLPAHHEAATPKQQHRSPSKKRCSGSRPKSRCVFPSVATRAVRREPRRAPHRRVVRSARGQARFAGYASRSSARWSPLVPVGDAGVPGKRSKRPARHAGAKVAALNSAPSPWAFPPALTTGPRYALQAAGRPVPEAGPTVICSSICALRHTPGLSVPGWTWSNNSKCP